MNFFRWIASLPFAAAVTIGLFIAMSGLIVRDAQTEPPKDAAQINILAKIRPTEPAPPKPTPSTLDKQDPPEIDTRNRTKSEKPGGLGELPDLEKEEIPVPGPKLGGGTPIIRAAPQYPEACRARGAEGVVLVRFDVTDRGEVTNVRIISSDNRCFDRTVIKTVMSWKYSPQARRDMVEKFVFTLTE